MRERCPSLLWQGLCPILTCKKTARISLCFWYCTLSVLLQCTCATEPSGFNDSLLLSLVLMANRSPVSSCDLWVAWLCLREILLLGRCLNAVTMQLFLLHHFVLLHRPRASIPRRVPADIRRQSLVSFRSTSLMWTWRTRTWVMVACLLAFHLQTRLEPSFEASAWSTATFHVPPRLFWVAPSQFVHVEGR